MGKKFIELNHFLKQKTHYSISLNQYIKLTRKVVIIYIVMPLFLLNFSLIKFNV